MKPDQGEFFTDLYCNYFNQIKLYAMAFVGDPDSAEEIAQDTFHTAWEKIDNLMEAEEPIWWLKRTAKHKIYNAHRVRRRYLNRFLSLDDLMFVEESAQGCVEDAVIEHEEESRRESVNDVIQETLTPDEIALLKWVVMKQMHYAEIAQELGISLWSCQKRIQWVREKLRKKFPGY